MDKRGLFIVLEGPDGCGKTTQFVWVIDYLRRELGYEVVTTREPGGSPLGVRVRQIILDTETPCATKLGEVFLFCADRHEHLAQVVLPAVQEGKIVVSDRFSPSTIVYQGYTSDEPGFLEKVIRLDEVAREGVAPDLCLVLWVDAETGLARGGVRRDEGGEWNEFDERVLEYHQRVALGYRWFVENNPLGLTNCVLVDATPDPMTVFAAVKAEIDKILPQLGG